jgi:hypothetical protein
MKTWQNYAKKHWRTIRDYDFGISGDPDVLTADEAWRTHTIRSHLTRDQCAVLVERASTARWSTVAADADLASSAPGTDPFKASSELYWHFSDPRMKGFQRPKLHKVLHVKRPFLFPILDSHLLSTYQAAAKEWVARFEVCKQGDSRTFWAAIRDDLIDEANARALDEYVEELRADADPQVAVMAELPSVRLLDIIAW